MRNFACFNELSIQPLCCSEEQVKQRVKDFLLMWQEVRGCTGVKKIRHESAMTMISLSQSLSLQDYINEHTRDAAVIALLGTFIHPQVDMEDDASLQNYFDTSVTIKMDEETSVTADGFNAAYCQGTFCVGFNSDVVWKNDFYDLTVTSNGKSTDVRWACVSSPFVDATPEEIETRKSVFGEWLRQFNPLTLVNSNSRPQDKPVSLRSDHGQKELEEHAKLLTQHENVEAILSSLSFKPWSRHYIDKITDDGLVDIVLWWENAGYSMRVKTTGRNAAETREIAKLLKEKYGRQ